MTPLPVSFDVSGSVVLLTGGGGFIGRALGTALQEAGARVLTPPRNELDAREMEAMDRFVEAHRPDAIVHLAGVVGGRAWLSEHDAQIRADGARMIEALVHAARARCVRRVLGVGSTAAYGPEAPRPLRESSLHVHPIPETIGGYAETKRSLGEALAQMTDTSAGFVLPCNIYGPGQRTDAQRANVVGALAMKFVAAVRDGAPSVPCFGANASREFLHVDDCAAGLLDALVRLDSPEPVNLGSGVGVSIRALTDEVSGACGFEGELDWGDVDEPADELFSDSTRARALLAWRPRIALAEGIERTVRHVEREMNAA